MPSSDADPNPPPAMPAADPFRPLLGLSVLAVVAAIVLLLAGHAVTTWRVRDGAMEPTVAAGDRLVGLSIALWGLEVEAGDLVTSVPPSPAIPAPALRRVVATRDDVVEIRDGSLRVNGQPGGRIPPRFIDAFPPGATLGLDRIAVHNVWVLAEAPWAGEDSRSYGMVPIPRLFDRAWLRIGPWARRCVFRGPRPPGFPTCPQPRSIAAPARRSDG